MTMPAGTPIEPHEAKEVHASMILRELIDGISEDHFTLEWLISHLPKNSFGIIFLFLGLFSLLPVISVAARFLILCLVLQIIMGYHSPVLPRRLLARRLPSHYLLHLDRHAIPALIRLERLIRPRWLGVLPVVRRGTAMIALLLTILSLIIPLPLANIPPAIITMLMALAYIEHDGILLIIALFLSVVFLGLVAALLLIPFF